MANHSSIYYNIGAIPLLPPLVRTATATSASIDLQNYDDVAFVLNVGATGDTLNGTNRVEASLQESADNSTWTQVADSDTTHVVTGETQTGTFAVINSSGATGQVYETGYHGNQRYVRVALTNYGTTSVGTAMDVLALVGRARQAPLNS